MDPVLDALTEAIIGAAIDVHKTLGPGLFESAYETCLTTELLRRGLALERQKALSLSYNGERMGIAYRLDLLVEGLVVVEIKAIERLERVHSAQLLAYLRLAGCKVGLLFNFNMPCLTRGGLKRVVNDYPE